MDIGQMIKHLGFSLLFLLTTMAQAETPKERLFILAGQSNMMGRGRTAELPEHLKQQPENISFYTHGRQSVIAKYNMFGPEVQFAHAMSKAYPNDKIIIIKTAASGSAIAEWMPDTPLYKGLLRQVGFVTDPATTNLEAIVWMQGETDARNAEAAQQYADNLKVFINSLRKDLKAESVPFIIGRITEHGINFPMEKVVRAAQNAVGKDDPNIIVVPTDGISKIYDKVHFDAKGQVELGKRFAVEFLKRRKEQLIELADSKNKTN